MEQRQLGDSGLFSSAIGFGTWEMSTTMYGHIDVKEASDAVNAAIDHGSPSSILPRYTGHTTLKCFWQRRWAIEEKRSS